MRAIVAYLVCMQCRYVCVPVAVAGPGWMGGCLRMVGTEGLGVYLC